MGEEEEQDDQDMGEEEESDGDENQEEDFKGEEEVAKKIKFQTCPTCKLLQTE